MIGLDVAAWLQGHLPDPADHRRPLRLTDGQLDFMHSWYTLDAAGRFAYRRGALQQAKGWGKSPLAAFLAIAELCGPVRADGSTWADPLVQIAALSEDQADSNVFALARELLAANDGQAANVLGIDVGRTRFYLKGRPGKLEAVTADAGSREGQRVTFAVLDESHLWTRRNGGLAIARTIRRNAAKVGGRVLECSNAPELGLGSVAEATLSDAERGEPGILLVASRPPKAPDAEMTDEELLELVAHVYRDAPWVDRRRILAEVHDTATPWDEAIRYYFNVPAGATAMLLDPARWAQLLRADATIPDGARVAIGFDGSHAHDGTAVVICAEDGLLSLELLIEREANDPPDWTVPRNQVHDLIAELFDRFRVARMMCDPFFWRSELDTWSRQYGERIVLEHATNSVRRFGPAVDRFRAAVSTGGIGHTGDADLTRHLLNARLHRGPGRAEDDGHALYTLEKPGPGRLIDAAVAAVLAYEAMATAEPERVLAEPFVMYA